MHMVEWSRDQGATLGHLRSSHSLRVVMEEFQKTDPTARSTSVTAKEWRSLTCGPSAVFSGPMARIGYLEPGVNSLASHSSSHFHTLSANSGLVLLLRAYLQENASGSCGHLGMLDRPRPVMLKLRFPWPAVLSGFWR